jgi:hypothetical protein
MRSRTASLVAHCAYSSARLGKRPGSAKPSSFLGGSIAVRRGRGRVREHAAPLGEAGLGDPDRRGAAVHGDATPLEPIRANLIGREEREDEAEEDAANGDGTEAPQECSVPGEVHVPERRCDPAEGP